MKPHYDTIGKTYTRTRAADPRIVNHLVELLALDTPAKILDIGAGTGNYSWALAEKGFEVDALEPSEVMRTQAKPHPQLSWHAATAEEMKFADHSFDAVVMTLCLHHLSNWQEVILNALRVSSGPIVIFAFDRDHEDPFWLFDYFPKLVEIDKAWTPSIAELGKFVSGQLHAKFQQFPFPLPKDLIDHFAYADWANPEVYLSEDFRNGISTFSKLKNDELQSGLEKLKVDLDTGAWQEKHGQILEEDSFDRGFLFIRITH